MRSTLFVLIAVLLAANIAANAAEDDSKAAWKEVEKLRKAQEEMLKQMQAQQQRIEQLEKQVKAAPLPAPRSTTAIIDSKVAGASDASGGLKWSDLTVAGTSKLKFYGFLRLDAIYDDSAPNNTLVPSSIRSEDVTAPAGIRAFKNNNDFTVHPRLTRMGIDFVGPKMTTLGCPELTGKVEIDFYNNGLLGQAESREAVRMRHAYLKLKWDEVSLLAGQTADVISPLFPVVNPDFVMWGAGNLGDRRPQLRAEWLHQVGPGKINLQGEIGMTSADDNLDLDPAGTTGAGFRDGETSGRPTLQARASYKMPLAWEKQNFEFGTWIHRSWEEPDARFLNRHEFDSEAYGFDVSVPLYKEWMWFKSEGWFGRNLADVRGGILQGINTAKGREIRALGGFVEIGGRLPMLKWYSPSIGYSRDDPNNSDLSTAGRASNRVFYFSQRFNFDPIELGFDYLYWRTDYMGFDKGIDNRFQAFISYKF